MAEANPSYAAIWLSDFIAAPAATVLSTPQITRSGFPYSNLLNPLRSRSVRTSNTDAGGSAYTYHDFTFDLGSAKTPNCFALVDASISASQTVSLQGYDDSALTTGLVQWDFTAYETAEPHGVMRFYPDTSNADTGTIPSGKRYWRVRFAVGATSASGYAEIGQVLLGTYTSIRISPPREDIMDASRTSESDGGAVYTDALGQFSQLRIEAEVLSRPDYYSLTRAIAAQGKKLMLVDLHAGSNDASLRPYSARYGMISSDRQLSGALQSVTNNSLGFDFTEARG